MLSKHNTIGFCVDFTDIVFDQNWSKPKEDKWKQDQKNKTKIVDK